MLTELLPRQYEFEFGEGIIALRFTLKSFLELERRGLNYTDIFVEKVSGRVILEFFRAGLVTLIEPEKLGDIAEIVGYEKLLGYCIEAIIQAFPKRDPNVVTKPPSPNDEEFSFVRLRTLICDVMGKSEDFFWSSTIGELIERWVEYGTAMGYIEEPEKILEFDDEGM